ncbi:MAG: SpoVA/SpoVAEb family sporulation membrane protein [Oscillospiraceae bacterium]|nr:SpoVA/SpoVAEb family sporulation membrane protein [Oscillospiraceae bacterium]
MKVTPAMYQTMTSKAEPPSRSAVNISVAFLTGGLICVIGQLLLTGFMQLGLTQDAAAAWTSVTLVACSAVLTGFGLYERLARHAGAGTLVPITGFANAVTSAAIEAKTEGYVLGIGTKIFTIAGPVILYGCTAAAVYGVILYLTQFFPGR